MVERRGKLRETAGQGANLLGDAGAVDEALGQSLAVELLEDVLVVNVLENCDLASMRVRGDEERSALHVYTAHGTLHSHLTPTHRLVKQLVHLGLAADLGLFAENAVAELAEQLGGLEERGRRGIETTRCTQQRLWVKSRY